MKHCTYCGRKWDSLAAQCPECGTEEFVHVPPPLPRAAPPLSEVLESFVCQCCQRWNPIPPGATSFNCRFCGTPSGGRTGLHQPASRRDLAMAAGAWAAAVVIGLTVFGFKSVSVRAAESRWATELSRLEAQHASALASEDEARVRRVEDEEARHQKLLNDPAFRSGDLAFDRHEEEWQRRLRHDVSLAKSPLEQTLLKMQEMGADTAVTAQRALEEVTRLGAPKGSRVEVTPAGDGFRIRVAFKMSAVSDNEAGAATKHLTPEAMRAEVREISARLTRDLFDYCGSRGIEELQLSCNHGEFRRIIPRNATPAEEAELWKSAPVTMACIYRVAIDKAAARRVTNWRAVPLSTVVGLSRVDRDRISTIRFGLERGDRRVTVDPQTPLEF